jgi:hypothetical protein
MRWCRSRVGADANREIGVPGIVCLVEGMKGWGEGGQRRAGAGAAAGRDVYGWRLTVGFGRGWV